MKTFFLRKFFKILGKSPAEMPMVQYWKTKESVSAKLTTDKNGVQVMHMEGEKYIFPGFPRGHVLYGKLSKLKHEIKNQIFNESWALLEEKRPIVPHVKKVLLNIYDLLEDQQYDVLPPEKYCIAVREIYRAWTKAVGQSRLRDVLCHILQEDDSYRWRVQWIAGYFRWFGNPVKIFDKALAVLEHGEVLDDMKERQRLLRRVLIELLKDEEIKRKFVAFYKECDWKKVRLTEADKYFFRGKYFKVDYQLFDY